MPEIPPTVISRLSGGLRNSRGLLRPLGLGLGLGAAGTGVGYGVKLGFDAYGRAHNPPLQKIAIDTNGDGIPETVVLADTRTGAYSGYGEKPSDKGEPERSTERVWETGLIVAGLAAVALVVLRGS